MACIPCQKKVKKPTYNIANAVIDTITLKADFVPKEIQDERLNICFNCPTNDLKMNICQVCKCYVKTKVKFAKSSCPKGHWDSVEPKLNNIQENNK